MTLCRRQLRSHKELIQPRSAARRVLSPQMPSLSYLWATRGRRGNNKLRKVLAAHSLTELRKVWSEVMKHNTDVK